MEVYRAPGKQSEKLRSEEPAESRYDKDLRFIGGNRLAVLPADPLRLQHGEPQFFRDDAHRSFSIAAPSTGGSIGIGHNRTDYVVSMKERERRYRYFRATGEYDSHGTSAFLL